MIRDLPNSNLINRAVESGTALPKVVVVDAQESPYPVESHIEYVAHVIDETGVVHRQEASAPDDVRRWMVEFECVPRDVAQEVWSDLVKIRGGDTRGQR